MAHWPGHERTPKDKGKHRLESSCWRWPHLDYGSIGSVTLVSKDGRAQWSTLVDTSDSPRWLPFGKSVKIFPETRPSQLCIHKHSARQRAEKGLQYLRAYFPDADFPGELLGNTLEADASEMDRLESFDPFLGNLLDIIPSHQVQNEYVVVFPMGEFRTELNVSRLSPGSSGNMVFNPTGSPSFKFETPILQISSAVGPSPWTPSPSSALLVRTHTSSSLFHLERSEVTRDLDITRTDTGDLPIADARILASGPDIVAVNRSGKVYKCDTHRSSTAMQFVGAYEVSNDDHFWQLGITGRNDECFLASSKAVRHFDLRSGASAADVFSLEHPNIVVTSFESPMRDHISRITTTSDVIWLDDRFCRRPLLSFKHYRSFDRTLRVLTADLGNASFSLLTSRQNDLVTLYDISRGSDDLLHCNSNPSCLPYAAPAFTSYGGHALAVFPSGVKLAFLRLCQHGSIHRQDIRVAQADEDHPESVEEGHVTHQWNEDVLRLQEQSNEMQVDFGPAGGKHFTETNFRGAYAKMFSVADNIQGDADQTRFTDTLARLPDVWQDFEGTAESMLTTFDVISGVEDGNERPLHTNPLERNNIDSKQAFDTLMRGDPTARKLADLARWHYSIQGTSIPAHDYSFINCAALHESLEELNLVSEAERHDLSVQRQTKAREQLVVDLALSKDVYSTRPLARPHSIPASDETSDPIVLPMETPYSNEPPEVKFGYFRPTRKVGADHYAGKEQDGASDPGISAPLGVRLLLAEWQLGTDPGDYTYRDPYGVADMDAQPTPQYRKLPATLLTQKKQIPPQRPPPVVAAATQPPTVHTMESQVIQQTHSQQPEGGFEGSQEPMTSTQVLPGPFGGRPGKKAGKKRMGGF